MKGALTALCLLALSLAGCATARESALNKAREFVGYACKQPEHYRQALRVDVWECCGVDTSQACIPADQRTRPPWLP